MSQPSSYTSSSESGPGQVRRALATLAWIIGWLIILDVLVDIAFRYPSDPRATNPSQLQLYFDYGRSAEAKLRRMTGNSAATSAPITQAGWYQPIVVQEAPNRPGAAIVTFYGMSHSVRLANALNRTSRRYAARSVGAPGATANWSYGAFQRDLGGGKSKAVVLSIMSANLPMIDTMSPITWNVSFPMPYTEDRYYEKDGRLTVVHPPFQSFEQYLSTFHDPAKWAAARRIIAANDTMYDSFLVRESVLDHSSIVRLIRRAYEQRLEREARSQVFTRGGFNATSEQVRVANGIVRDFAVDARSHGLIPVVFIANNLGYSNSLYRALEGTLEANHIPFLNSAAVVSPDDPRGYLPDSHFTDANDDRLARALAVVIDRAVAQPAAPR
jgi:hypothetical protein